MQCAFCGNTVEDGLQQCPRCGGEMPGSAEPDQIFSSAPPQPPSSGSPFYPDSVSPSPMFGESPPAGDGSTPPAPGQDPEAGMHTALVSLGDRQADLSTKLVEAPPAPPEPAVIERKGLPDSRVARGVEDSLIDLKRVIYRFGRIGRVAFYSHLVVIFGCVSPWFFRPHQGYTPGIEAWGALPLALSLAGVGMLAWRHRPTPRHRVAPVLLHLLVAAALVLAVLWRYQVTSEIQPHLRPELAFGFYITGLGGLGALLGSLLGLKDVR